MSRQGSSILVVAGSQMLPPRKFLKPTMPAAAVMAMASSVKQLFVKRMVEAFFGQGGSRGWDEPLAKLGRAWVFRDDAPDLGKKSCWRHVWD